MAVTFHARYVALVDAIERNFAVAQWKSADVDIWPLARFDLYLDMYRQSVGEDMPMPHAFPLRVAGNFLRPLRNLWKSRRDIAHWVHSPRLAHAVLLGDGFSLDFIDNAWRDRFGEPIIAALEKQGLDTFLMQAGDLNRLPWHRPTFAASLIASKGWLKSLTIAAQLELPDHAAVLQFLEENGVAAPSLAATALKSRADHVAGTAFWFEKLLDQIKPKMAFVISSFAGPAPGFVLACRRQGILSVDLQRAPISGTPMTYSWSNVPQNGYTTLPAIFWTWDAEEAAVVEAWAGRLASPWHLGLHGGHTQLAAFLENGVRDWDQKIRALGSPAVREVLVTLQPLDGNQALWNELADQIQAAPDCWRWWLRRHPASRPDQDAAYGRLLSLRQPNVLMEPASSLPLPALMRHMHAVVSLGSGAAGEAEMFGVPALFLSKHALEPFGELVARGKARLVPIEDLVVSIAQLPARLPSTPQLSAPGIQETLGRLDELARDYALLKGRHQPFAPNSAAQNHSRQMVF